MAYLSVDDLPNCGDVVFCKWPGEPANNPARRVLVLASSVRIVGNSTEEVGVLQIAYGTGTPPNGPIDGGRYLVVEQAQARECGLTKRTFFDLNANKWLVWTDEKFVSPGYLRDQGVHLGSLNSELLLALVAKLKLKELS